MHAMSTSTFWLRLTLAGVLLSGSAGAAWGQTLSPEDRLAAIRKGLVQAALEGPTQVSTTQWIDANGSLQESSSFRTGMQVRGVRVLGYGADAQGDPMARLQWQNADTVAAAPSGSATKPACKSTTGGRLQHVLAWSLSGDSPWSADSAPLIEELQANALAQLQQAGASNALWRLVERPRASARSSYEKTLLGSSVDHLPWELSLQIDPVVAAPTAAVSTPQVHAGRSEAPAATPAAPEPAGPSVQARIVLTGRGQSKPTFQSSATLSLGAREDNWGRPSLSSAARAQLAQQIQTWSQEMQRQLGCLAVMADVTQAGGPQIRINAGAAAGVRVGDEWVIARDRNLVQRALEPGIAAQTVLARVQAVGEHYAQLRPLAGDKQNIQTTWTAWSAEANR